MKIALKTLLPYLLPLAFLLPLGGCSCGFDCNNDDDDNDTVTRLTLGLSDSLPEDLKQVVIEVDSITFIRSGVDDIVVDTFTVAGQGVDLDTFTIDLLSYSGISQLKVIDGLEIAPGFYNAVSIAIVTDGVNNSYVQQDDDELRAIELSGTTLRLPGIQLDAGDQAFTVEFGLAQALQYKASTETYLLTTTGIRIEDNQTAATLSGTVDSVLFDSVSPCSSKSTPTKGNRVYLYKGTGLLDENLADVFTSQSTITPPETAVAPFAVASMRQSTQTLNWEYSFGFIPAGSYTFAFACDTATDDAVEWNELVIPLPTSQKYQITLTEAQNSQCNLAEDASC